MTLHIQHAFFPLLAMHSQTQDARVLLAIKAIESTRKLSRRAAAKLYNVPKATLRHRINGRTTMADRRPANQLLTEIEEEVVVQYILSLDAQGFSPLIGDVEAMVNSILGLISTTSRRSSSSWHFRPPIRGQ